MHLPLNTEPAPLELTGEGLSVAEVMRLIGDERVGVELDPEALQRVRRSQEFLEHAAADSVVYGVNTGFGPMASHVIGTSNLASLQANLVRSHAAGMGAPVSEDYVLAAMVARLNALLKGYSGVSVELLARLKRLIDLRIVPVVPEHGAVGTSGDLVQLAHIALALIGEGKVAHRGQVYASALEVPGADMTPYALKMKEGLALINGTSMMTGIGVLLIDAAEGLISVALRNGALALELVNAYEDGISPTLHALRPHAGQIRIASELRKLVADSRCLRSRDELSGHDHAEEDTRQLPESVQEVYSLRCIAQVLGPVVDALASARSVVEVELNSVVDNPIVDVSERRVLHGGNFHGDYVSFAADQLKIALIKLGMLSERRTSFFLSEKSNRRFPPFMNLAEPGLTLGLQGLQFVATSTVAQSQTLGFPQYLHSIPTNDDNQDVVSMGTDAALLAMKVVRNIYTVLTIEAVTLSQGVDYLGSEAALSSASREYYRLVREALPAVEQDRVILEELDLLQHRIETDPWVRVRLSDG